MDDVVSFINVDFHFRPPGSCVSEEFVGVWRLVGRNIQVH